MVVLAGMWDLRLGPRLPIGERVELGLDVGIGFLGRYPIIIDAGAQEDVATTVSYFYQQGRFFFPLSGIGVRYRPGDRFDVGADLRVYFPLFHAWDGEARPFADQMLGSLTVSFGLLPADR